MILTVEGWIWFTGLNFPAHVRIAHLWAIAYNPACPTMEILLK